MTERTRTAFPTGRTLAKALTHISWEAAAHSELETNTARGPATIIQLPQVGEVEYGTSPSINRIEWDTPTVAVVERGTSQTFRWVIQDSTLDTMTGALTVTANGTVTGNPPPTTSGLTHLTTTTSGRRRTRQVLNNIAAEGNHHLFVLVAELTAFTHRAVSAAAKRVYREIHDLPREDPDERVIAAIDSVEADAVVDSMLYGEPGESSSVIIRLLRRAALTDLTTRKSTMKIIATAIWSSAETRVRAAIGDPHAGRIIRRIARSINSTDPETVLAAYRHAHPDKSMGVSRIQAALTADATAAARRFGQVVDL